MELESLRKVKDRFEAVDLITKEYFKGIVKYPYNVATIILALKDKRIVGFAIATNPTEGEIEKHPSISYIAVDSDLKREGIGTALMFATACKMKELNRRIFVLDYILERSKKEKDSQLFKERFIERQEFYENFASKFGLSVKRKEFYSSLC